MKWSDKILQSTSKREGHCVTVQGHRHIPHALSLSLQESLAMALLAGRMWGNSKNGGRG